MNNDPWWIRLFTFLLGIWFVYDTLYGPQRDGILLTIAVILLAISMFVRALGGPKSERPVAVSFIVVAVLGALHSVFVSVEASVWDALPWMVFTALCGVSACRTLSCR